VFSDRRSCGSRAPTRHPKFLCLVTRSHAPPWQPFPEADTTTRSEAADLPRCLQHAPLPPQTRRHAPVQPAPASCAAVHGLTVVAAVPDPSPSQLSCSIRSYRGHCRTRFEPLQYTVTSLHPTTPDPSSFISQKKKKKKKKKKKLHWPILDIYSSKINN
jgi:hypothetical protein